MASEFSVNKLKVVSNFLVGLTDRFGFFDNLNVMNQLTEDGLATDAVTTTKLPDNAVTAAKIENPLIELDYNFRQEGDLAIGDKYYIGRTRHDITVVEMYATTTNWSTIKVYYGWGNASVDPRSSTIGDITSSDWTIWDHAGVLTSFATSTIPADRSIWIEVIDDAVAGNASDLIFTMHCRRQ
jgi:hypothetical protein